MNTLISEPLARKIRFESDTMWVELADGRQMGVPLAYFPLLSLNIVWRKASLRVGFRASDLEFCAADVLSSSLWRAP
jgi:hypothetical protein